MKEQFLKKLITSLSKEEAGACKRLLLLQNIEVYRPDPERKGSFLYAGEEDELPEGSIYVPAADYDRAVETLSAAGYAGRISTSPDEDAMTDDPFEQVQRDFQKRRKLHMIEWAVIIAAVILYNLLRMSR